MISSGLLNFRCCCALRLEGKSHVGIIPFSVSSEGRIMPCCMYHFFTTAFVHHCTSLPFFIPFRGGGALRYTVPKWLLFVDNCGEWLSLPA